MNMATPNLFELIRTTLFRFFAGYNSNSSEQTPSSSSKRLTSISEEEKKKVQQIEQQVFTNLNSKHTQTKMKDLYYERILHDFIMLNPDISLNALFAQFEKKPLEISHVLNRLERKRRVIFTSQNGQNHVRTTKQDFKNNLILKRIYEKEPEKYRQLLQLLNQPDTSYHFKDNLLTISSKSEKPLQVFIQKWKKL